MVCGCGVCNLAGREKSGRELKAVYRLGENGYIAAELDLVAAEFAMEVK